jgi:hypothetical protein
VVCERVIDLAVPEGRCVGYATVVPGDCENGDSDDDNDGDRGRERCGNRDHAPPLLCDSLASLTALASPRHWIRAYLHPQEVEYAVEECPSDNGRTSFLLGRLALRQALATAHLASSISRSVTEDVSEDSQVSSITYSEASALSPSLADCLLRDGHGRPRVPGGFLGSVSHKRNVAVALVAQTDRRGEPGGTSDNDHDPRVAAFAASSPRGIGVDLEGTRSRSKINVARKVLTPQEMDELGSVPVRAGRAGVCVRDLFFAPPQVVDGHVIIDLSLTSA